MARLLFMDDFTLCHQTARCLTHLLRVIPLASIFPWGSGLACQSAVAPVLGWLSSMPLIFPPTGGALATTAA